MDKYEFNIKLDQIKKLADKKDFSTAAKIARTMDWRKVKDWTTLSLIINVQENDGDFEEARDIAILAYNRNLGGRRLVYKLTEIFIKLGELDDAEALYKEYARMSQLDINKFILLYNLRKAQKVSDDRLIEILEEYKEHELDERFLMELAQLYSNTGRVDDCLKECEEIVLWFQDGTYVEKALRLKQQYTQLSAAQQKILDNAAKAQEVDLEKIKQQEFAEAKQKARLLEDEIEAAFMEDSKKHSKINLDVKDEDEISNIENSNNTAKEEEEESEDEAADVSMNESTGLHNPEHNPKNDTTDEEVNEDESSTGKIDIIPIQNLNKSEVELAKVGQSLRELIENAKRKIESNYLQVKKDDEEELIREQIEKLEVPVNDYNLYDTQNIQKEIAKNIDDLIKQNPDDDLFKNFTPNVGYVPQKEMPILSQKVSLAEDSKDIADTSEEDSQIEGQLSLEDWIEAIQEEKYGKQNTKEFSKAELEKLIEQREIEKEEYEKLLAKQKLLAEASGEVFNEELARRNAQEQVILQSVKNDLAIRTGKATAKIEADVENIREAARLTAQIKENAEKEAERISNEIKLEAKTPKEGNIVHLDVFKDIFEESEKSEEFSDQDDKDVPSNQEEEVSHKLDETAATDFESGNSDNQEQMEAYDNLLQSEYESDELEDIDHNQVGIPDSVKKYFKKYMEIPGLQEQLAHYFTASREENMMKTSETGNIIISGNRSSDKTSLAINIVKALNTLYPENPRKIAKTTGESVNHKGVAKAMSKLKGSALIIEDAGVIEPKRVSEILEVLEKDTEGMIVFFEDADTEINVLLNVNPDISNKFNYRIVLKQYTVNELVEMAKKYAGKRQHIIDDNALLQLYLKIDRLHAQVDYVRLDQIKEIIDRAILKAERRATKRFFGGLKKRRGENGEVFLLMEIDFKD